MIPLGEWNVANGQPFRKECPECGYKTPVTEKHITGADLSYRAPCLNCGYWLVGTVEIGVPPKPPKEDDFPGDYFAYQRALTAYEAGKKASEAINKAFSDRDEADRSVKQSEIVRQRAEAHAERVEDAREIIADFDEVMGEMKGVNVRNDVIDEIMQSDKSALLAYHLAKNPEKLDALNRMSPRELAREMGRLEATVQMPTAKKQTSAPPPASAVKGGASPSSAESDLSSWLKKTYG